MRKTERKGIIFVISDVIYHLSILNVPDTEVSTFKNM